MTIDQAKYLSGVAEHIGIVNWAIIEYKPESALEHVQAFRFEGVGNLPRFKQQVYDWLLEKVTIEVKQKDNVVYVY